MLTVFRWLLGFIVTLALLVAVAVVVIPRVVDPNDHRDKLVELVKQKTGRDLRLEGDLSVSVFPWLGVRTQGLSLSQPTEIGPAGGPMIKVSTAQLRVKLLPLMSRRLEVDTVVLEQPQVRFITLKNGTNSFSGLAGAGETAEASPGAAIALVIQGVNISDGFALWDDRQAGAHYTITDLQLATGNLIGDELADFEFSGRVTDASSPQPIDFSIQGQSRINTDSLAINAADIDASFAQDGQSLALQMAEATVDSNQNVTARRVGFSAVLVSADMAGPSHVNGELEQLDYDSTAAAVTAQVIDTELVAALQEQQELSLRAALPKIVYQIDSQALKSDRVDIQGEFDGRPFKLSMPDLAASLAHQSATSGRLQINSGDLNAVLEPMKITALIDAPQASGAVRVEAFNLARLMRDLEIDYQPADTDVLTEVALQGSVNLGMDSFNISNMDLLLDQSRLTGRFAAKNPLSPMLDFDLELDQIDLDRYLPAVEEESDEHPAAGASALAVPMALFKDLHANGGFRATQLISGGIELNDIDLQIKSTPGKVSITPKASLYEGKLAGSMVFSQLDQKSVLRVKNEIDLIDLAKFLQATEVSDQLTGIGSLSLDLTVTEQDGIQSNSGSIKLLAKNGAIQGVDVQDIVESSYLRVQQLRGREATSKEGESDADDVTRFAELLGTFIIKDFKLSNNDFQLTAPLFQASGEGDIDIASDTLDYLVNVSIAENPGGQAGEALQKLKGVTVPIRFYGALSSPNFKLDMTALSKALIRQEIEQKKAEFVEEKLGVESDGKLSTKEILRQLLIKKIDEKTGHDEPDEVITIESPQADKQAPPDQPAQQPEPVTGAQTSAPETATDAVPDVMADPASETDQQAEEDPQSSEESLEDELKRKLLEEIFN